MTGHYLLRHVSGLSREPQCCLPKNVACQLTVEAKVFFTVVGSPGLYCLLPSVVACAQHLPLSVAACAQHFGGAEQNASLVRKQLIVIERAHELRAHVEKLESAGGLDAFVKKEKRHEKTVSAITKAMCALQDTDGIAEDCKEQWESFVTAMGAKKVVDAFTTMKG